MGWLLLKVRSLGWLRVSAWALRPQLCFDVGLYGQWGQPSG
jgi:hypothetical protein